MPETPALRAGAGESFRPAGGCPVASRWGAGEPVSHQGDAGSFLVADAAVRDGSAAVRLALWRCVWCGALVAGIAPADGDPDDTREFTWLEEAAVPAPDARDHDPARPAVIT